MTEYTELSVDGPTPCCLLLGAGFVSLHVHFFIKGVNVKFTPRPNLTLLGLFRYFWVYISHQKRDHPILESSHTIEAFPSKNISLQTSIVGEDQEHIQDGFCMDKS